MTASTGRWRRSRRWTVAAAALAVLAVVAGSAQSALDGGTGVRGDKTGFSSGSASCALLPIATSSATIGVAVLGNEVADILNSDLPGHQGWVAWAGSFSEVVLAASLALPGLSSTYVDPDEPADRAVSTGDWVRARPNAASGPLLRLALDWLVGKEIVVLVWDASRGSGASAAYRVAGLARFSITRHRAAESRVSARYLGPAECLPPTRRPTADDTRAVTAENASASIVLPARSPHPATLRFALAQPAHGSVTLDGPTSCSSMRAAGWGAASCSVTATYTPDAGFNGTDRFTFTVSDERTTSSPAVATIDVRPVNDAPRASDGAAGTRRRRTRPAN